MNHAIRSSALAIALACTLHAEGDLALEWRGLVDQARKDSGVVSTSSHTGIFDGVYTMNPKTKFLSGKSGDAAHALYKAAAVSFGKWAGEVGVKTSSTQGSDGELMQRMRAPGGDYVCLIYRPPAAEGAQGTFSVVYIDASKFIEGVKPIRNAEAVADQPATAPESTAKGKKKLKPKSKRRSQ